MPTAARVTPRADPAPIRTSPDRATLIVMARAPRPHVKQRFVCDVLRMRSGSGRSRLRPCVTVLALRGLTLICQKNAESEGVRNQ
jgi:hypothetical protein